MRATLAARESDVARNDVTVKIDKEVLRLAKIAAAFENKTVAEYLSDTLRPIVERDVERHSAAFKSKPKPKGGAS